jgi:hypothetical protein
MTEPLALCFRILGGGNVIRWHPEKSCSSVHDFSALYSLELSGFRTAASVGSCPSAGLNSQRCTWLSPSNIPRRIQTRKCYCANCGGRRSRLSQRKPLDTAAFPDSLFPLVPFAPESEPVAPRSESPVEPWMNEKQRKLAEVAARKLAETPATPRSAIRTPEYPGPDIQPPAKAAPLKIVKASAVISADLPGGLKKAVTDTKAAAFPQAPADQPTGAKAPTRKKGQVKGQESPGTQVPPPMETRARKKASVAGGLRGADGLGQTEIGVDHKGPPSKT